MKFEGSWTEENLEKALTGESKASIKYTFYAEKAKASGEYEAAEMFETFAKNEREHAKLWIKCLNYVKSTKENMEESIGCEHYEADDMYVEFAKMARQEKFIEIADLFESVGRIEKSHTNKFRKFLERDKNYEERSGCNTCGNLNDTPKKWKDCPICETTKYM